MSMETPTGLFQFPVTKLCMVTTGAVALSASVANCKYIFLARYEPFISDYKQYYRYFIFQLGFVNETDVALIILLWYQLRNLERIMGSYKYISVLSLALVYTTLCLAGLNLLLNSLLPWKVFNSLCTGPLGLILAMFHFYKEYTPQIYEFDILLTQPWTRRSNKKQHKWQLNDQFLVNALVIILMLNQGFSGIGCGFIGWLCGIFLDRGLFPGVDRWRLPFVERLLISAGFNDSGDGILDDADRYREIDTDAAGGNGNEPLTIDDENANDEPARPLGVQFLDTFRR